MLRIVPGILAFLMVAAVGCGQDAQTGVEADSVEPVEPEPEPAAPEPEPAAPEPEEPEPEPDAWILGCLNAAEAPATTLARLSDYAVPQNIDTEVLEGPYAGWFLGRYSIRFTGRHSFQGYQSQGLVVLRTACVPALGEDPGNGFPEISVGLEAGETVYVLLNPVDAVGAETPAVIVNQPRLRDSETSELDEFSFAEAYDHRAYDEGLKVEGIWGGSTPTFQVLTDSGDLLMSASLYSSYESASGWAQRIDGWSEFPESLRFRLQEVDATLTEVEVTVSLPALVNLGEECDSQAVRSRCAPGQGECIGRVCQMMP